MTKSPLTKNGDMRIVHVLSQTELTGSEVYASQLGREQIAAGHEVFYISDKLHVPVPGPLHAQPISKRSWPQRIRNIRFLREFLRREKIDVVHAHSRAASWVCHWATKGSRTAYVSTVHGRQHLHRSTKTYSVYGDRVIGVCENVRRHLEHEVGVEAFRLSAIPNGLSFAEWPEYAGFPSRKVVSLVGRSSGPKGVRAAEVIHQHVEQLLQEHPDLHFHLAGGPLKNYRAETRALLNELSLRYPGRVTVREYLPEAELAALIASSTLVIGSGRLAIHALGRGVPVLALGEAACHGIVTEQNCDEVMSSNFGDMLADATERVDAGTLARDLHGFLRDPSLPPPTLTGKVRMHYSVGRVGAAVQTVYFEALVERRIPRRIPILMYHKITEPAYESPHKTYIAEEGFAAHMRALHRLGFSTVTFADIEAAALGKRELPRKPVMLTFDDGYRGTHRRALPLMKQYGHRGVFYLMGDRSMRANGWDTPDEESALITDEELRELCAAGMEVGAHSMTHRHMSRLSEVEALYEARESKRRLEELSGQRMVSYAYPYGDICPQSKRVVREAGFSFAVATDSGGLHFAEDPFHLFRVNVFPQDGFLQLFKKTLPAYRSYYAWKRGK